MKKNAHIFCIIISVILICLYVISTQVCVEPSIFCQIESGVASMQKVLKLPIDIVAFFVIGADYGYVLYDYRPLIDFFTKTILLALIYIVLFITRRYFQSY